MSPRDLLASTSLSLGLQTCATMLSFSKRVLGNETEILLVLAKQAFYKLNHLLQDSSQLQPKRVLVSSDVFNYSVLCI